MSTLIEPIVSVADLDAMPDDGNRYELIEGEILMSRAPAITHQLISGNLFAAIKTYLDRNPIGKVIATPGLILSNYDAVIPDIVFIRNERFDEIVSDEKLIAAPDLVIEILSPGAENERRDRTSKRQLYGRYGVREYWVVDPKGRSISIYRPSRRGLRLAATLGEPDEIRTPLLPGFSLDVASAFSL
ncbi:MAG: Uma2 family endonuclease [Acidobacteriota bacterium]